MVNKNKIAAFFCAALISASAFALKVPELKGRVNDYANIISQSDEEEISRYLAAVEKQTTAQIVVLTVPSLKGDDIASFGIKVADSWKIGQSGKDNGVILIVAMQEHDVRIETGYGVEDTLTDVKCGLILRNVIIPEFKNGKYSRGILNGVKNIGGVISGDTEIIDDDVLNEKSDDDSLVGAVFMIIWLVFFFIIITSKNGILKWFILSRLFGMNMPRTGRKGGFSSGHSGGSTFRSGGLGSGFGSGGGFSGGGGHFGGGGASGHW